MSVRSAGQSFADVAVAGVSIEPVDLEMVAGRYYSLALGLVGTSNQLGNGTLSLAPFAITRQVTIDRLGAEVTGAGEAGSKLRLGIYADDNGRPGALLLDAGQIDGATIAAQEIAVSLTLAPGIYWQGAAVQSAPTTQPTVRIVGSTSHLTVRCDRGTAMIGLTALVARKQDAIGDGALPDPFVDSGVRGVAPHMAVRVA